MISGMDTPSIKNKFTYPPELKKEIGDYRIHHKESFAEEEADDYIKDIEAVTGKFIGLMGNVPFTPKVSDVVTRNGDKLDIDSIDLLSPNGQKVLYTIIFNG